MEQMISQTSDLCWHSCKECRDSVQKNTMDSMQASNSFFQTMMPKPTGRDRGEA